MTTEKDPYLGTLDRMEPDIAAVDTTAALASIAISLKRIADALGMIGDVAAGDRLANAITGAIYDGLRQGGRR